MRFIKYFGAFAVFLVLFIAWHAYTNAPVTTKEVFRDDEAEQAQRSIKNLERVVENNKGDYIARAAHAKGHACVKAWFNVNTDINPDLQYGVLSRPGHKYKSWIRFSNGSPKVIDSDDTEKDTRGMAIKLFNLGGNGQSQDFLMHDSSPFFLENIEDYNRFVESDNIIHYFFSSLNPFQWKLREMKLAFDTLRPPPPSPLWNHYFSNTAYKLGPNNIKFSARSCTMKQDVESDRDDADFLRKTMQKELTEADACFDFMVKAQQPGKYMPIEDPSIAWKESESPYIPVAKVIIPKQVFDTKEQQSFCENISFSPWNNLPEHRPIGELNRIRKVVYAALSKYRHEKNNTVVPTDLDWSL